jgi:hypothetical protein
MEKFVDVSQHIGVPLLKVFRNVAAAARLWRGRLRKKNRLEEVVSRAGWGLATTRMVVVSSIYILPPGE